MYVHRIKYVPAETYILFHKSIILEKSITFVSFHTVEVFGPSDKLALDINLDS